MMLLVSSLLEIGTQEEKGLEELQEWNGESNDYTYRISKCALKSFWNSFLVKIITPKNGKVTKCTNMLLCGPFVSVLVAGFKMSLDQNCSWFQMWFVGTLLAWIVSTYHQIYNCLQAKQLRQHPGWHSRGRGYNTGRECFIVIKPLRLEKHGELLTY